jgi:glyceraldehyde 3-phosphate dehydrogenase
MIKVNDLCGIEQAYITTITLHNRPKFTRSTAQRFTSGSWSQSIVPTTTGAAKALTKIFPEFEGKMVDAGYEYLFLMAH